MKISPSLRPSAKQRALRLIAYALVGLGVAACDLPDWGGTGGTNTAKSHSANRFYSLELTGADYAQGFALHDATNRVRTLTEFNGKVVFVFFGFTQCPDVCPTTLGEMTMLRKALGADGQRVQVVFVTVDPERDTASVLQAYMHAFDPDDSGAFVALRPSPQELRDVTRAFRVYYAKVPGKTASSYTIDHTAGSYVFDPQGRVRLFTRYGGDLEKLRQDVQTLLAENTS